jgi:uracil-DNA glycosylase
VTTAQIIQGLPTDWANFLDHRLDDLDLPSVNAALAETNAGLAFPPRGLVFEAFRRTPPDRVRAVILGQDPYPTKGQACGLAFSVPAKLPTGVRRPTSLGNILSELRREGFSAPVGSTLNAWPDVGVLLLNTAMTVRAGAPGSRLELWRPFAKAVIEGLVGQSDPIVFLLLGRQAREWVDAIKPPHLTLLSPHPAARGRGPRFRDDVPFSRANDALVKLGIPPIDWDLAERPSGRSVWLAAWRGSHGVADASSTPPTPTQHGGFSSQLGSGQTLAGVQPVRAGRLLG